MKRALAGIFSLGTLFFLFGVPRASRAADEPPPAPSPSRKLRDLASAYWTDLLRTNPIEATVFVGDHRFNDRLDDPSPEAYQAWLDRIDTFRGELGEIDPSAACHWDGYAESYR